MVMVCQVASMVTHDHVSRYHVHAPTPSWGGFAGFT